MLKEKGFLAPSWQNLDFKGSKAKKVGIKRMMSYG